MDKQFSFWQKWLTYVNVMIIFLGIFIALFSNSVIFDLHNNGTKNVFFGGKDLSPEVLNLKNWLFGIIGGTIVGFHLLMVFISEYAFKRKEKWAYWAFWFGLLSWFVIDSGISYLYGAIHNIVIINLVALILIGLPLIMTRKEFSAN
jgi:hypothetical protein